jgi:site-specific DNA recombinase
MARAKRAAIYTRISDAREDDVAGVTRQAEDCAALCTERGWSIVQTITDNNVSATKRAISARAGGAELLRLVAEREIDVVVVWSVDRLYRRPADLEGLVDSLGEVPVVAVKSGDVDLSTADGRLVARLLGAAAAHESEKRGERVARAAAQRAQEGRYGGGRRRMGYSTDATELVLDEADAVREAYERVVAGGTLESIVRDWRKRFGTGTLGGEITGVQVRDILLRPMNAGIAVYKGAEVGRTALPAIVDEETWRTARAILTDPARRTTRGRPPRSLLAPVLRCGFCGGRIGSHTRDRRSNGKSIGGKTPAYRCRAGHVSRDRGLLDHAVSELVLAWLIKHADRLSRPRVAAGATAAARASTEADALGRRLDSLAKLVAAGDLEPADYAIATREIRDRLAAVEETIAASTGSPNAAAIVRAPDIRSSWDEASVDQRRSVIREVIERITLNRATPGPFTMGGVEITWREAA